MHAPPDHLPEPPEQQPRRTLRRALSTLIVGLLLASCAALGLIPLLTTGAQSQSQIDHAFQVLFAALFALLGLLLLLTERQLRQRVWPRAPVSFARLLFTTPSSLTFWMGLVLFGVALARLEAPAVAGPLNIVFWVLVGLWLLAQLLLNVWGMLRPRRARAPGRDEV